MWGGVVKLSLDLDTLSSSALRILAFVLADTSACRHRGQRMGHYRQLMNCIVELERRANGGDTAVLRATAVNLRQAIEASRAGRKS